MVRENIARTSSRRCAAAAVLCAVAAAGCNRPGGVAEQANPTAATLGICIGGPGVCIADPGSAPADCSQDDTVDTLVVESFDDYNSSTTNSAQDLYTYTDGTSALSFETYGHTLANNLQTGWEPPVTEAPDSIAKCHTHPASYYRGVLHAFGGPFLGWGGGLGVSSAKLNGRLGVHYAEQRGTGLTATGASIGDAGAATGDPFAPKDNCCVNALMVTDGGTPCVMTQDPRYAAVCPPADSEYAVATAAIDVSQYDGVSFWARRGPNSQAGIRVMVGDKYTDDDLNYLALTEEANTGQPQPTYCHRNRECDCLNHQECTAIPLQTLNDDLAAQNPGNVTMIMGTESATNLVSVCGTVPPAGWNPLNSCLNNELECVGTGGGPSFCCDVSNCNSVYAAFPCDQLPNTGPFADAGMVHGDPQFYGRPCTPYQFPNGVGGSYCYDPATDPPPWPSTELCGDFWMVTVDLTTDWQFFKVPFTNLRQQGWAKRQPKLDLTSVSVVRFSWDTGWIDYWIDQVSFYREKSGNAGAQ